ncbi:hypothetical protein O6H91_01G162200 [Diphasiastrum complanatum]|uniref:Uncharacterized protein n=1 Tax=Diphasiastrum complanatum TaxID=34168 RepID=A0ACC2EY95_DIPCM|nr:hypothetical protein O6H91_01G162200 [Diphasiastrum complanatum]
MGFLTAVGGSNKSNESKRIPSHHKEMFFSCMLDCSALLCPVSVFMYVYCPVYCSVLLLARHTIRKCFLTVYWIVLHCCVQYLFSCTFTVLFAAYCTGLLLARRLLQRMELDSQYEGNVEASGEDYNVEAGEGRRPFRALLDVGLVRTTTGNRVFGALKGALDGGLDIPHSDKRFAGFSKEDKSLNAETHRKYIFGGHVTDYMKQLREDEPEKYQSHFSSFLKEGVEPEHLADLYAKVHAAIRADPSIQYTEKKVPKEKRSWKMKKLSYDERKANLIARISSLNQEEEEE